VFLPENKEKSERIFNGKDFWLIFDWGYRKIVIFQSNREVRSRAASIGSALNPAKK
jgi:hypothetical protein